MQKTEITIDEEFKHLMPALDKKTHAALETSLTENGCRDALILWEGILIDGHNRFEICTRLEIPFQIVSMAFPSRDAVRLWIIETQMGRRNLSPIQLAYFRGVHYRMEKKLVTNIRGNNQHNEVDAHFEHQPQTIATAARLSEKYKVGSATIKRDAKASEAIDAIGETSPEAKSKILASEIRFGKKELSELLDMPEDKLSEVVKSIEDGTYEKCSPAGTGIMQTDDTDSGSSSAPSDVLPAVVSAVTGSAYRSLLKASTAGKTVQTKRSLRKFIDMLEDLYAKM